MPYIKQEHRERVADGVGPFNSGELNYTITKLCIDYLVERDYDEFNEVVGVLECVKQEFYRRMVAPYEDKKIEENGDVY
jgi:hypothetical protein